MVYVDIIDKACLRFNHFSFSCNGPVDNSAGSLFMGEIMYDVVYILKNDISSDEFRYSLRSVAKNFTYRKVWTFGGCPEDIKPDRKIIVEQEGANKWEKVANTLRMVCRNSGITEDFWLFNDDFFIMQKVEKLHPMIRGDLKDRVESLQDKYGYMTRYARRLRDTEKILMEAGCGTKDFTLHVPMLINRETLQECLDRFPGCPMFRSLYGNYAGIGGTVAEDVKITGLDTVPTGDEILLSTSDKSFRDGAVGEYIRQAFPDMCKYETCR